MQTSRSISLAIAAFLCVGAPLIAQGTPTSGDIFYTRFGGFVRLKKVAFDWDGTTLTLGARQNIATLPAADGLVFAPDQDILVGGQGTSLIYKVDPATGTYQSAFGGGSAVYHLTLDPGEQKVWGAALPGAIAEVPLNPFANGVRHQVRGNDTAVTQLAFVGADVYYTSSTSSGNGNFGVIDLTTFTTTRLLSGVPAAHGMSVDPITNELFLFGAKQVWQIQPDPTNPTVVATLDLAGSVGTLDQGAVDGLGHAFIADNNGNLVLLDYSGSGRIDDPSTLVEIAFLDTFLDDVAPVAGTGSPCAFSASWNNYGGGWAGTRGVPGLTSDANPTFGAPLNLMLENSVGSPTPGCIAYGLAPAATPTTLGGTILVGSITVVQTLMLPATGSVVPLTVPALVGPFCGIAIHAQGFQLDVGASHQVAFSPGLKLVVGL